ncbi:MAG: hypothetical protein LLG15_04585 [Betaproteobacteria bacterium]|nr:hypothetical protein [Betaproteobacteria bacterium]
MEFFIVGGAALIMAFAANEFAIPAIDKLVTDRVRSKISKQTLMYEPSNLVPAPSIISPDHVASSANE